MSILLRQKMDDVLCKEWMQTIFCRLTDLLCNLWGKGLVKTFSNEACPFWSVLSTAPSYWIPLSTIWSEQNETDKCKATLNNSIHSTDHSSAPALKASDSTIDLCSLAAPNQMCLESLVLDGQICMKKTRVWCGCFDSDHLASDICI